MLAHDADSEFEAKFERGIVETATVFLESKQVLLRVAALLVGYALASSARFYGDEARMAELLEAASFRSTIKVA